MNTNKHVIWDFVSRNQKRFQELADKVWSTPETCYSEQNSMSAHVDELKYHGFSVTKGIANIPTAVVGEYGNGGPIIAFLGEYDALAGLSQKADVFHQDPIKKGANGHGCGHNLLGSASMQAAVALKEWLKDSNLPGVVRYYGCPAEEGGAAKTFMVRDKIFKDVDAAITWHPGCLPGIVKGSSLANCRVDFTFEGRASHAAVSPHLGRSALDAIELMNVGVNYMREHMPDKARIHYALIDGGGISPNVVQAKAQVRYVVRDETTPKMMELLERVKEIAKGAALMTQTKVKTKILAGVSNLVYNETLGNIMQGNLDQLGAPEFSKEDHLYAKKYQDTLTRKDIESAYSNAGIDLVEGQVLAETVVAGDVKPVDMGGSTDVADVSWVVPTVSLWGANYAIGTPFHSWQMTAQGKSSIAIKGMTHAAMVMAATGSDLILNKTILDDAWSEHNKTIEKEGYMLPISLSASPPVKDMAP
ncbi:M20 family metallopeptidase [Paracoccaceae bacterium]|nr:M20 family metallopeptidase [Paracoccaceae bacterium]